MFGCTRHIVFGAIFAAMLPGAGALACGFHGAVYGGLTIPYPGSLSVAISIAKARQQGVLPQNDPQRRSFSAFHAAMTRLEDLRAKLLARAPSGAGTDVQQFSVLFVGSRLWSHYRLSETTVEVDPHMAGPVVGSPVVLTDDSVLDAVLANRLDVQDALELGLISVAGDSTGSLAKLLVSSLKQPSQG